MIETSDEWVDLTSDEWVDLELEMPQDQENQYPGVDGTSFCQKPDRMNPISHRNNLMANFRF